MQTSCSKEQFIYAGFFSRWMAFLTDTVLLAIILFIVKVPLWFVKASASDLFLFKPFLFKFTAVDVFYYLLTLAYFVLMTYYSGATVGKHLMKLKVVDSEGQKLTFMSVLVRESVGKYLSAFIVYIGYIMAAFDSRKQSLHDKIADTCVVYKIGLNQAKAQLPMQPVAPVQSGQPVSFGQQLNQPMQPGQPTPLAQPPMQPRQPQQSGELIPSGPNGRFSLPEQPVQNGRFSQQPMPFEQPVQPTNPVQTSQPIQPAQPESGVTDASVQPQQENSEI